MVTLSKLNGETSLNWGAGNPSLMIFFSDRMGDINHINGILYAWVIQLDPGRFSRASCPGSRP